MKRKYTMECMVDENTVVTYDTNLGVVYDIEVFTDFRGLDLNITASLRAQGPIEFQKLKNEAQAHWEHYSLEPRKQEPEDWSGGNDAA